MKTYQISDVKSVVAYARLLGAGESFSVLLNDATREQVRAVLSKESAKFSVKLGVRQVRRSNKAIASDYGQYRFAFRQTVVTRGCDKG